MQSMIPMKKNRPKGDVSEAYKKKIKDQTKNPDVKKFTTSTGGIRLSASEVIKTKVRATDVLEKAAQYQPPEFGRTLKEWTGTRLPDRLLAEDREIIEAFVVKQDQRGEWLSSIDGTLWCKTGDGKIATPENSEFLATWKDGPIRYNPTTFQKDNFESLAINAVKKALKRRKASESKQAWKELPKGDFDAIKSFLHKKPASGESVRSDGELLKVQTDHHEKTLARWRGDRLTTEPPETQFEDVVLSWLYRWEPKYAAKKPEQALSLSQEKEELSRAIESWEPKLPNFKDWAKRVMKAQDFSELRELWDELWEMKEEQSVEVNPSKHEFREYVDMEARMQKHSIKDPALIEEIEMLREMLGSDALLDEFLANSTDEEIDELLEEVIQTQGLPDGPVGPGADRQHKSRLRKRSQSTTPPSTTDTDNFEQAYNAVGGDPDKITDWLKSNKGADPVKNPQLKNTVTDWLAKSKNIKTGLTDTEVPFLKPDPAAFCRGACEGTGLVAIRAQETDPTWKKLWDEAEEAEHTVDGWHFVKCPECHGTGKILVTE